MITNNARWDTPVPSINLRVLFLLMGLRLLHCLTSLRSPPSGGRRQWSLAGKFPAAAPQMRTLARSRSATVNDASRKDFSLRLAVSSGSYLLSRDLASDYHRRADVSLPGSEWVRVGPSGCDHRIADVRRVGRLLCVRLSPGEELVCVLALSQHLASAWEQADIRVACGCFSVV